jgi:uncharacterized protein with GYD domain
MFQGNYTGDAIRNLIHKPEDRAEAAGKLAKSLGGKLRDYYMSFGDHDFIAILELPDDEAAATLSLTVSAAGHVTHGRTTKLLTVSESMKVMARAGKAHIKTPKGK